MPNRPDRPHLLPLALSMARRRPAALVSVAAAAAGAAALLSAVGVLALSGLGAHAPVERLAAADVVVAADQTLRPPDDIAISLPERARIPADVVAELADLPGVVEAVAETAFPAAVLVDGSPVAVPDPATTGRGASAALLGDPALDGTAPGPGEVALGGRLADAAGLAVGDEADVVLAGRTTTARVSGVVRGDGTAVVVDDATAGAIAADRTPAAAGGPTVDLIGLVTDGRAPEDVAADARTVLGTGFVVATGDARGELERPDAAASRGLLPALAASLAGVVLLVVGSVVAGTLGVAVQAQRRELALLRAIGATPRQVRRLVASQATAVAAVAGALGAALGLPLAAALADLLVRSGLLPAAVPLAPGVLPAAVALLVVVAVVRLAAVGAVWRTSRLPATEAVAESQSEPRAPSRRRTRAGLLVLLGATVLGVTPLLDRSAIGAAGTTVSGLVAAVGLALLGPALVGSVGRALARRLPARSAVTTWLAVANTHGYALRVGSAVASLALAVVFTFTYAFTQTSLLGAATAQARSGTLAQLSVGAPALGGLPEGATEAVAGAPGVRDVARTSTTTVVLDHPVLGQSSLEATSALVLDPAAAGVLDLDVGAGSLADLRGRAVALDASTARAVGTAVGGSMDLLLGDGTTVTADVVATYDRALGFGPVVVARDLVAGHTTSGLDQGLLVRTDGSVAASSAVEAVVAGLPGVVATGTAGSPYTGGSPGPDGSAAAGPAVPPELWLNVAVLGVLMAYLLLGIVTTLVTSTSRRRGEFATLRLVGATPRQVLAMVRREAAVAIGIALTAGTALAVVPLGILGTALLGRPWPAGPPLLVPVVVLVVAGVTAVAIAVPARRALSTPPVDARART